MIEDCLRVFNWNYGDLLTIHCPKQPDNVSSAFSPSCSKDLVSLHQCSLEIRPKEPSLQRWVNQLNNVVFTASLIIRWEAMITLDICWAQFDATRAFQKILEVNNQERIVADVMMDQEVLPGVGNIIKNEACFNAGVNPLSMIRDVPEDVIRRLVGV